MRLYNNPHLADLLKRGNLHDLAFKEYFDLDDAIDDEIAKHLHEIETQLPHLTTAQQLARAQYRALTHNGKGPFGPHLKKPEKIAAPIARFWDRHTILAAIVILVTIAIITLFAVGKAHGEPRPDNLRAVRNAFGLPQQSGGLIVQVQSSGTPIGTYPAFLVLNCSTNMACSASGTTVTLSASSTAATAFSGLTASANTNAGTFSASGNSWDFSGATLFKFAVGSGSTVTAVGTSGQVLESNADGTFTPADPIVSGPDAPGSAPTRNPVQVGVFDGTNVQRMNGDTSGRVNVNVNGTVPVSGTFWQATQPVSIASMPTTPVTGTFWQATQPVSGTFWQSTQPVSLASLPALAAGTNVIGHVIADSGSTTAVTSLPSIPAGSSTIGAVTGSGNFAQGETNSSGANQAHVGCDKSIVYDASTSGSTQLVALVSGKSIYVCGFNLFSAGTANVKLTYGTGTACATGTTSLTPAYELIAQTGMSYGNGEGTIATVPASDALCISSSAAVAVQALISYAQF